jgi:hypothetical protein
LRTATGSSPRAAFSNPSRSFLGNKKVEENVMFPLLHGGEGGIRRLESFNYITSFAVILPYLPHISELIVLFNIR